MPIFRCYKSIKQRKSVDVKHKKCCFFDDREEKSLILFRRPLEMDKQTNKVRRQSLPKTSPCGKADKDCKTLTSEIGKPLIIKSSETPSPLATL